VWPIGVRRDSGAANDPLERRRDLVDPRVVDAAVRDVDDAVCTRLEDAQLG
jgi:hypothetical protein